MKVGMGGELEVCCELCEVAGTHRWRLRERALPRHGCGAKATFGHREESRAETRREVEHACAAEVHKQDDNGASGLLDIGQGA